MAQYVKIVKIKSLPQAHYYEISSPDYSHEKALFMEIIPEGQVIHIYDDPNYSHKILSVHINEAANMMIPKNMPRHIVFPALVQARKAIMNRTFPGDISFHAG
jgi:hypothetical protein